jgi:hypothetical protein
VRISSEIFICCDADAVNLAEGSICGTAMRGVMGSPESLARGMLSQRLPVNPGELTVPYRTTGVVDPAHNRTRSAGAAEGRRQERKAFAGQVSARQGRPEACVTDSRAVLRTHSTDEGGEPQGPDEGRPRYPLEGRGKQVDGPMRGRRPETQISEKPVPWT